MEEEATAEKKQIFNDCIVIRYIVYVMGAGQHPWAGRNTQDVLYKQQAQAGRNTFCPYMIVH